MNIHLTLILLWTVLSVRPAAPITSKFKVFWLPLSANLNKKMTSQGIFCHRPSVKTIHNLWSTIEIHVEVFRGKVNVNSGKSPQEVLYNFDFLTVTKYEVFNMNPFNTGCIFIDSTVREYSIVNEYSIQLFSTNVDYWRVKIMAAGLMVVFTSKFLSRNPVIFYLFASCLVVISSFLLLLYFISQRSIKLSVTTAILLAGTAYVSLRNMSSKYILVTGLLGFVVAYRIGPPTNPRTKNIIMWVFQGIGIAMIRWSSWQEEASLVIAIIALGITYLFPCMAKKLQKKLVF